MAGVNIRRLAAIDIYGTRLAKRRRRIIRAEFITGAVVMVAFGVWLAASSGRAVGFCIIGCGLNYALLAAYAIALGRPGCMGPAVPVVCLSIPGAREDLAWGSPRCRSRYW